MHHLLRVVLIGLALSSTSLADILPTIRDKTSSGSVLVLDDGSIWKVGTAGRLNTALWMRLDQLRVFKTDTPRVYEIVNLSAKNSAYVLFLDKE